MLVVDAGRKKIKELNMKTTGAVDTGLKFHLYEMESYKKDVYDGENALVLSSGPFAHPDVPGANRGVVTFRSPLTGSFMVSSAGNLGHYVRLTGEDAVAVVGRSEIPLVIAVVGEKAETQAYFFEMENDDEFREGIFSFAEFLEKELADVYSGAPFRVIVAGPASEHTDYGVLASREAKINSWDYFGRGGPGSVLVRAHNVYAIAIGGSAGEEDGKEIRERVLKKYRKEVSALAAEKTKKYRFVEDEGLGGTIINWAHLKSTLPAFNWKTIYLSSKEREELWEEYIKPTVERMKSAFSSGVFKSTTCGERCPAVCKKIYREHKLDYEPITSLGAQLGIFELDNIVQIVKRCDELGFDAIELGNTIAWAFDLAEDGQYSIENARMTPFEIDEDVQTETVLEIIEEIARGSRPELSSGIKKNAEKIGKGSENMGVYVPYSSGGSIVPPQYWVPGFLIPLPLHGKFMTHYGASYMSPRELGRKAWERFVAELMVENAGFCRFHRGWAEDLIPELYSGNIKYEVEKLSSLIVYYNKNAGAEPQFPESRRAQDVIYKFFELWDKQEDALNFFEEVRAGLAEARAVSLK